MSLIVACEDLAVLSATPIRAGQVLDIPYPLARQMIKAGLAVKAYPYSLAFYPVRLPEVGVKPPIHVQPHATPGRDRHGKDRASNARVLGRAAGVRMHMTATSR